VVVTHLVERAVEAGVIGRAVTDVEAGTGRFVLVEGPAGIGKSAVVAEAARLGAKSGLRVLKARSLELEHEVGFGLVRQWFEPIVNSLDEVALAELFRGGVAAARSVLAPVAGDTAPAGDFAVLHGLYWLTVNLCQVEPLMLICDDLHWADTDSLRFLTYLLPRLEGLPVCVVAAARQRGTDPDQRLLDLLRTDASCTVLCPAPLTTDGAAAVVQQQLGIAADEQFVEACRRVTGGNPLLLTELTHAAAAAGVMPSRANAERMLDFGSGTLSTRVRLNIARMSTDCAQLARAVAVLGDDAPMATAAALAGLDLSSAAKAAQELQSEHILEVLSSGRIANGSASSPGLGWIEPIVHFVHTLVAAAVYEGIDIPDRFDAHAKAARLLEKEGDVERVATHLLRTPPTGDENVATLLRQASAVALRRASPSAAVAYLQRCIQEPPPADQRLATLEQLGRAAQSVDSEVAARYLEQAIQLTADPVRKARLSIPLGLALLQLGGSRDHEVEVWRDARDHLPEGHEEIGRRLDAGLINIALITPDRPELFANVDRLRALPFHDSSGARALDSVLSRHFGFMGEPHAIELARRALAGDSLIRMGDTAVVSAWITLLAADDPAVMTSIETAVTYAHEHGAIRDLASALCFRALGRLWRGDLEGAEADARRCFRVTEASNLNVARAFVAPFLADVLLEQGRIDETTPVMEWVGLGKDIPSTGPFHFYADTRARLLRCQGNFKEALRASLSAGELFPLHGSNNPAILPWRTEAAQCLHALGRESDAYDLVGDEIDLARKWGAPRALGRALRIGATMQSGDQAIELAEQAVSILADSPARLEYAKALVTLGATLKIVGHISAARPYLRQGYDLASICGAKALVENARSQLIAAGARPRRAALSGPESLTPSERRVADLAAQMHTNREIAQSLFVTPKTVEVHLSNAYKKLGITTRQQLKGILPEAASTAS